MRSWHSLLSFSTKIIHDSCVLCVAFTWNLRILHGECELRAMAIGVCTCGAYINYEKCYYGGRTHPSVLGPDAFQHLWFYEPGTNLTGTRCFQRNGIISRKKKKTNFRSNSSAIPRTNQTIFLEFTSTILSLWTWSNSTVVDLRLDTTVQLCTQHAMPSCDVGMVQVSPEFRVISSLNNDCQQSEMICVDFPKCSACGTVDSNPPIITSNNNKKCLEAINHILTCIVSSERGRKLS